MRVRLLAVTELLEQVAHHEMEDFIEAYPGSFLMAMGLLSAEVLRAKTRNETTAISLGPTAKHDVTQHHPLAGWTPRGEHHDCHHCNCMAILLPLCM